MSLGILNNPISIKEVKENIRSLKKTKASIKYYKVKSEVLRKLSLVSFVSTAFSIVIFVLNMSLKTAETTNLSDYQAIDYAIACFFIISSAVLLFALLLKVVLFLWMLIVTHKNCEDKDRSGNTIKQDVDYSEDLDSTEKKLRLINLKIKLAEILSSEKSPDECIVLEGIIAKDDSLKSQVMNLKRTPTMEEYLAIKSWVEKGPERIIEQILKEKTNKKKKRAEKSLESMLSGDSHV